MTRAGPTGITISTERGERIGYLHWFFGCRLHRVWFADHRGGWSGVNFHLQFLWLDWCVCLLRWRTPRKPVESVRSLRQQIRETHGDPWEKRDTTATEQHDAFALENQRVMEEIQRRNQAEPDVQPCKLGGNVPGPGAGECDGYCDCPS